MLRLGVHPGGLPRISSMTAACNAPLIHRLKRRSREDADPALAKLIEEGRVLPPRRAAGRLGHRAGGLAELQTPLGEVKLFTVIATLGAPLDVTAANLTIETFPRRWTPRAQRGSPSSAPRSARAHAPSTWAQASPSERPQRLQSRAAFRHCCGSRRHLSATRHANARAGIARRKDLQTAFGRSRRDSNARPSARTERVFRSGADIPCKRRGSRVSCCSAGLRLYRS